MSSESDVTCPLHNGLESNIQTLFSKIDRLLEKIFWIMLVQVISAFLVGGDVMLKVIQIIGAHK